MLRILFWNVRGSKRSACDAALAIVPALVCEFEPDILTLIEAPTDTELRLANTGVRLRPVAHQVDDNPRGLRTFGLSDRLTLSECGADRHFRAYQVTLRGHQPLTLAAVHLRSPINDKGDPARPRMRAGRCRAFVEDIERDTGHRRTIVYGDFNMDPFSPAMVDINGLNAVSTAFRARRTRTSEGTTRATFYNPTWSLFGDRPPPAGSLYVDDDGPSGYFWHMPDQVLLRTELSEHLDELVLVDEVGATKLVSQKAEKPCVSDHLPMLITLNESVWTK